jgi:hypothetical protein
VETRYGFNLTVIVKNSFTALVASSCAFALYDGGPSFDAWIIEAEWAAGLTIDDLTLWAFLEGDARGAPRTATR